MWGESLNFRSGLPAGAVGITLLVVLLSAPAGSAIAADFDGLFYGGNDFGDVGLLQTPTARMRPDGEFGVGVSTVRPYNQVLLFAQPLPWLETSLHYVDITNRLYSSDPSFSGNQHYKHRGVDAKLRLLTEGHYRPSVALGLQDIGGTGLFSSEYLVSSYHYYDLDFSFGVAWGRMGARGGIRNPFALVSKHFDQDRFAGSSTAGGLNSGRLFSGHDIGPFGGAQWNTPLKGLAVQLEYDGNNYQHEPLGDNQKVNSPLNVGLSYRGLRGLDLGVGYERGNRVTARLAIYTNFQTLLGVAKTGDPAPVAPAAAEAARGDAPNVAETAPAAAPGDSSVASSGAASGAPAAGPGEPRNDTVDRQHKDAYVLQLRQLMAQQGFIVHGVDYDSEAHEVRVWLSQDKFRNPAKAFGRAARVLSAITPAEISKFTVITVEQGSETYRASVERDAFEASARGEAEPEVALSAIELTGPAKKGYEQAEYVDYTSAPKFSWDMGPAVRQSVGGPDGFYFGQLYWKVAAGVQATDHLRLTGAAGFNIVNNFNGIKLQSNSTLPHVRSDIVKYLQQGKNGVINLEADYVWSPYPDWYSRFSGGIFEEMYGGLATELLYRPFGKTWAVALDVNRVRKRGFDEQFDFLPYTVTTGHLTLYYRPNFYNLLFKLSAGQYLARDRGGTIDISREFDNGVRLGIFATKTNVSAAQFGEGSFDKGFYLVLPLDLFFAQSSRRTAAFAFRPLTRDGGQMVYDGPELYFTVKGDQPEDFARGASELLK